MILAIDFLEVHPCCALVLAQMLHGGRAGGGGDVPAVQLCDGSNPGIGLDGDAHLLDVGGGGKRHVLLARGVVGGRAAFDVHRAVLHEGNAVLRGDRLVLDIQIGHAQLLLDVRQCALAQFHMESGELAVAEGEGQAAGGFAHAHGHGTAVLDLLQGAIERLGQGRQDRQSAGQSQCKGEAAFHGSLLLLRVIVERTFYARLNGLSKPPPARLPPAVAVPTSGRRHRLVQGACGAYRAQRCVPGPARGSRRRS